MKSNWNEAVKFTLKEEGGWTNDSRDRGGATNYGITIADVRKYVKPDASPADVKKLTQQQAIKIYKNKYWKTPYYDCDTLASGVDLSVFDFGVNSGPSRAKRYLLQAIGGSDRETIVKLNDMRLAFCKQIKDPGGWGDYGKGWSARIKRCKDKSLELNTKPSVSNVGLGTAISGILATISAFIMGHKALITVTGALILVGGILYYLEKRKLSKWIKQSEKSKRG